MTRLTLPRWRAITRVLPASWRERLFHRLPNAWQAAAWGEFAERERERHRAAAAFAEMDHVGDLVAAELERLRRFRP